MVGTRYDTVVYVGCQILLCRRSSSWRCHRILKTPSSIMLWTINLRVAYCYFKIDMIVYISLYTLNWVKSIDVRVIFFILFFWSAIVGSPGSPGPWFMSGGGSASLPPLYATGYNKLDVHLFNIHTTLIALSYAACLTSDIRLSCGVSKHFLDPQSRRWTCWHLANCNRKSCLALHVFCFDCL